MTREEERLQEDRERRAHWKRWGPYLSERQWGTVREDYSAHGTAWDDFPHDHARSRAYRWGEDGLAGISDNHQRLCFALALWNGRDPILKERAFGLTGGEGNHGEDVKEYYFYLDSTPTHSYMKYLYKYPQGAFPYGELVAEGRRRDRRAPEYELLETGVFDEDRYFDVTVEYSKAGPDEVLVRLAATNRGPEPAALHRLPTLWFRNTWSWKPGSERPVLRGQRGGAGHATVEAEHPSLGSRWLYCQGTPRLLFTENESNASRLWGVPNAGPYTKDGIDQFVVHGRTEAVNPEPVGTKMAAGYEMTLAPGETRTVELRLTNSPMALRRGVRRRPRPAPSRGGRVLRDRDSGHPLGRRPRRDAPGLGRPALEQAVLSLRRADVAGGRSGRAPPATRPTPGPQRRLASSVQRGHHLHAGQVGVSLVRGLGPGLPLCPARPDRSRVRQGPARAVPARVVHAPQRSDPRLRVGARRRQSARARVGRPPRLQDRE